MILHHAHRFESLAALDACMGEPSLAAQAARARGVLVQVFSASTDRVLLQSIVARVHQHWPSAAVVGATTLGEILDGRLLTGQILLGFTFFETSHVRTLAAPCQDKDVHTMGMELGRAIRAEDEPVRGVLLLATSLGMDAASLLRGMESTLGTCPVFGGGAADYATRSETRVFDGRHWVEHGAVAVVLSGDALEIDARSCLGWRPLSRTMRITRSEGLQVMEVDDQPAIEVYRRYLGIHNDDNFFLNTLEFPFLIERDGHLLARVPIEAHADGSLTFMADLHQGERFRIGYGDLDLIAEDVRDMQAGMRDFSPQLQWLFSCGCRRFLMQEGVERETLPFGDIAPTFGFYTYGEFFSDDRPRMHNSTLLAVGLREGPAQARSEPVEMVEPELVVEDPYADRHVRVVTRLMRFIDAVTRELEQANQEVTRLSLIDHLTSLANRNCLDQALEDNLAQARRYGTPFSVIMLDVDHFKSINDRHGHLLGDQVLITLADTLANQVRKADLVGRWGGEEFLVVLPSTGLDGAVQLARVLCAAVAETPMPEVAQVTASFGVTCHAPGDDVIHLVRRADAALYAAKRLGRNRVASDIPE